MMMFVYAAMLWVGQLLSTMKKLNTYTRRFDMRKITEDINR